MNQAEWEKSVEWVGVVAGCLIRKDNKYLLVQEKQPKAYGLWNLPGGHVDKGEDIEAAALREAKEESGYDVELVDEIAIYHESTGRPVKHIFSAKIVGGKLLPQPEEILDVKWLTFDEIRDLQKNGKIRAPWIWDLINKLEKPN
jgi:8-oxo-dGTP pyrophosphatase MutT (NUDIX family)